MILDSAPSELSDEELEHMIDLLRRELTGEPPLLEMKPVEGLPDVKPN